MLAMWVAILLSEILLCLLSVSHLTSGAAAPTAQDNQVYNSSDYILKQLSKIMYFQDDRR